MLRKALCLFLLLAVAYAIVATPWLFAVRNIEVTGHETLSVQNIEELAGVWRGSHLLRLNVAEMKERLLSSPHIAEASVRRILPSTIEISIVESIGIAVIPYHDAFIAIDREGVAISIVHDFSRVNLPIITGLLVTEVALDTKVQCARLEPARQVLLNLPNIVRPSISEVHVANNGDVYLVTTQGVRIKLGTTAPSQTRLALLPAVLYAYAERGLSRTNVEYIDMTGEVPIYKGR